MRSLIQCLEYNSATGNFKFYKSMAIFSKEDLYNHEMLQASQEEGVPVSVMKGFFALESQFEAKSYKFEAHLNDASYGISQILFNTAKGLGYTGTPEGLYDPYTSAKYGARFMANLHKKYPNDFDMISAYNAGYPRPAAKTTPIIVGIYGQPGASWVYANQPYVDRVASYIAYYAAIEKNDLKTAAEIKAILGKPSAWPKEFSKYSEARRYLRPIYFTETLDIMNNLKKWGLIGFSVLAIYFAVKNIHTTVNGK